MSQAIASIILRASILDWFSLPLGLAAIGATIGGLYWRFFAQWLKGIRGRDWATVSAVIDVVSVVPQTVQTRYGERLVGYLGTLTYFYHNPELQMGEYSRMFDSESESDAQAWVGSYKGQTVIVHVDPRDPSRSVLRKDEL